MAEDDQQKYEHFYVLIERHKALIEVLCMRRASGDSRYCAELLQECYICIWRHEQQISRDLLPVQESQWIHWLCRSAFSRLRYLQRAHLLVPLEEGMSDALPDTPCDDTLRDRIELLSALLNANERRALLLMAEGYTPDEMAHELGIKRRSAIQLRYRIMTKLRHHYQKNNTK